MTTYPEFGRSPHGNKAYWTRERVLDGLRLFARLEQPAGMLPRSGEELEQLRTHPEVPPARVVWKYFGSLVAGWLAVRPEIPRDRIPLKDGHVRWTEDEDEFLLDRAGTLTLETIARRLHRTTGATRARLNRTHGIKARENQGHLSAAAVAQEYDCSYHRVIDLIREGTLPAQMHERDTRYLVDPSAITSEVVALLRRPKATHREENGYETDRGDYERRYGLTRRVGEDGHVRRVMRGAA